MMSMTQCYKVRTAGVIAMVVGIANFAHASQITQFSPPSGTLQRGTTTQAEVRIVNTNSSPTAFWIGLSYYDPSVAGEWPNPPSAWLDVRPVQTTRELEVGEVYTATLSHNIPGWMRKGSYRAITAVWHGYNSIDDLMVEPRYDSQEKAAFTIETDPSVQDLTHFLTPPARVLSMPYTLTHRFPYPANPTRIVEGPELSLTAKDISSGGDAKLQFRIDKRSGSDVNFIFGATSSGDFDESGHSQVIVMLPKNATIVDAEISIKGKTDRQIKGATIITTACALANVIPGFQVPTTLAELGWKVIEKLAEHIILQGLWANVSAKYFDEPNPVAFNVTDSANVYVIRFDNEAISQGSRIATFDRMDLILEIKFNGTPGPISILPDLRYQIPGAVAMGGRKATFLTTSIVSDSAIHEWRSRLDIYPVAMGLITEPVALAIQSNPSGVGIQVSPADKSGQQNGTTPFSRSYDPGTSVMLTAPSSASGRPFKEWRRDGVVYTYNRSVTVEIDSPRTMSAVYEVLDSDIWVAGSANPESFALSGGPGYTPTVKIPVYNRKTVPVTVNVMKSGNAASWVTLTDGTSFTLAGNELKEYRATISVPHGTAGGQYIAIIDFNGVEQQFNITVAIAGEPFEESYGSASINADWSSVTKEFGHYGYDWHISGKTQMPAQPYLQLTDHEALNADYMWLRFRAERREATDSQNLNLYLNGNYVGFIRASTATPNEWNIWTAQNYWWHFLRGSSVGVNSASVRLSTYNVNDTVTRWLVFRDGVSLMMRQTQSAWASPAQDVPSVHWSRIQDEYLDDARIYARVDSVFAGGKVTLYINGEKVGDKTLSSSNQGSETYWNISRNDLERYDNVFVIKGETTGSGGNGTGTRVNLSNLRFLLTFYSQTPCLALTQEVTPAPIQVGGQATVKVRIQNSAADSSTGNRTSLTCAALPSGLSLVSGSLVNSDFAEVLREGQSKEHTYVIRGDQVGRYTLGGARYEFRTIDGDFMLIESDPVVIDVRGGGLVVDPVITERHAGGSVLLECTANVTAVIGGGHMADATVQGQVYKQSGANWVPVGSAIALGYDPALQRFKGSSPWLNEAGNYKFVVTAERQYYDSGSSGEYPFVVTGPPSHVVSVSSSGASSVVIASSTAHGGTTPYSHSILQNTAVALEAPEYVGTGAARKRFSEWTGAINSTERAISFAMDAAKALTVNYVEPPPNNPPNPPTLISPTNGSTGVSLTPTLEAGPFSDPDPGDTHSGSRWMVFNAAGTEIVWDSGVAAAATSSQVPPEGNLEYSTEFIWSVWYYDSQGETYNAGPGPFSFTTMADPGAVVATPTFNPDGGSHSGSSVNVTISCATEGATIRYTSGYGTTTDDDPTTTPGDDPTTTSTIVPADGIVSVPVPGWLKARAWKDGMTESVVVIATYDSLFRYTVVNEQAIITGYNGACSTIMIPSTLGGYTVTAIGDWAFEGYTSLTSVTIPGSVATIGVGAFRYCSNLTSVTIPGSVVYIGDGAFLGCYSLVSITVDSNNQNYSSLDDVLFDKAQTTLLLFPCDKADTYAIPDSVTTVGDRAFMYNGRLTRVTIPDSVTTIGTSAFMFCVSLTSVTIPDSVTTIGGLAFSDCMSLTSVTIPDGVTTISDWMFSYCFSLPSVTIPGSVTTIGEGAFENCTSLTSVYFAGDAPTHGSNVFSLGTPATIYHILTTTGWPPLGDLWADRPTALWSPTDITPPTVTIISPTSTSTWTSPNATMNIGGTSWDNIAVTRVTVVNARDGIVSNATGTTTWQYSGLALSNGINEITVTAYDAAGNSGTATITVTYGRAYNATRTPWAVGATIQAEDFDHGGPGVAYHDTTTANQGGKYRTGEGVDIAQMAGTGNGHVVGWTKTGEWMEYTVNVPTAGNYKLEARVASAAAGARFRVLFGGVDKTGELTVPNTGSWTAFQTMSATVNLSAGMQIMRIAMVRESSAAAVAGFDWFKLTPWTEPAQEAYNATRTPWAVGATIQAEDFDYGGAGMAYHDTTTANLGGAYRTGESVDIAAMAGTGNGHVVGWTKTGEWLEYTVNVPTAGSYRLEARVASTAAGARFRVLFGGVDKTGELTVPNTGSWSAFQTMSATVNLSAGVQVLRVEMMRESTAAAVAGFDWFKLTQWTEPVQEAYNATRTPWAVGAPIQAEDFDYGGAEVAYHDTTPANLGGAYRPGDGVDITAMPGAGNGHVVDSTLQTEWIEYTVNVPTAGNYKLEARVASAAAGARFRVLFGGVDKTGELIVPNTGSWTAFQTMSATVNLSAGVQVMQVAMGTESAAGFVAGFDWFKLTQEPVQEAYNATRTPWAVGATIQAEDFDYGGAGVAYHDTTTANLGAAYRASEGVDIAAMAGTGNGHVVGWTKTGEWMEYTVNVPTVGSYKLEARVASAAAGARFRVLFGGVDKTGELTVTNTGSWSAFQTMSATVNLSAGVQVLRVEMVRESPAGAVAGFDWFRITTEGPPATVTISGRLIDSLTGDGIGGWDIFVLNQAMETIAEIVTSVGADPGRYVLEVPYGWSGSLQPYLGISALINGYSWSPEVLTYQNLTANRTEQNFVWIYPRSQYVYPGGGAWDIGATIEAENFNYGGFGVAYFDTTAANQGGAYRPDEGVDIASMAGTGNGYVVGWTKTGEWMEYMVYVVTEGDYILRTRLASAAAGARFRVWFGDVDKTGEIVVPNTGSWSAFTTVSTPVHLSAGEQRMRVEMVRESAAGAVAAFDWFRIDHAASPAMIVDEDGLDRDKDTANRAERRQPLDVRTSDEADAPLAGWATVDGDPRTTWTGRADAGGWWITLVYDPPLALNRLSVELDPPSLTDMHVLTSLDADEWTDFDDTGEGGPIDLRYLWLIFPDDGSGNVPRVKEIRLE